jgi:small subunit ribosomal protein S6
MLKRYETVFIATPVLSDEQMKETVKKLHDFLKKNNATLVHEESWGLKKLAYPIQKKSTGFYHLIEFDADGSIIQEMETDLKRDERILRFLTVGIDKHASAYNEKRRKQRAEKKESATT